jgi:uncharacterized protein YecE (DUF72 family)
MNNQGATIFIGTSGWQYRHWTFYPKGTSAPKMFEEYLDHFNTVELNSSFYHQPSRETFGGWRKKTPAGFVFSVKASRYITHNKKLHDAKDATDYCIECAEGLGKKLGPILFQMPPSWQIDLERLESFLKLLPRRRQCTFEFRNPSWMTEETYALLKKYNRAFCIYELAGFESPHEVTADFIYIRLHGPSLFKYNGNYSKPSLKRWAAEINEWKKRVKNIYVYFDNDAHGYAPKNALTLKELIS